MRLPSSAQLAPLRLEGFRNLFFATFGSSFGTLLAAVALTIDVKDRTSSSPYSGLWVGAVLIVEFLPTIFVGLLLGPLLDRLERRSLMIAADALAGRRLRGAAVRAERRDGRRSRARRRPRDRLLPAGRVRRAFRTSCRTQICPLRTPCSRRSRT